MFFYFPEYYSQSFKVLRAIGNIAYGQGEFGEIMQICEKIDPSSGDSWTNAWEGMADKLYNKATEDMAKKHFVTARYEYCRANGYYHNAQFFLEPDDPRRPVIYKKYMDAFDKGTEKDEYKPVRVHIPYEDTFLYGIWAETPLKDPSGKTPTMVWFGGLDSTAEEAYFAICKDFLKRGFNCLIVDGPGQGASLRLNHVLIRYDYEVAGTAAFDYLETRDDVDLNRVAVVAWSLGGYLAPRIVSFEHRYAACITYGAGYNVGAGWRKRVTETPNHALIRYGKMVHGVTDVEEVVEKFKPFNLEGVLQGVTCSVLITTGSSSPQDNVDGAKRVADEMVNAKRVDFHVFDTESGGCAHVCADNQSVGNAYTTDWLYDVFGMNCQKA